jgi:serine/threonine protein kinase
VLEKNVLFGENNRYELVEHLGSGGFSQVWKAIDLQLQGDVVALKIFAPENGLNVDGIRMLQEEYKVVDGIMHRNLLKSQHFAVYDNSPYLVMPFCLNGSLRNVINNTVATDDKPLVRLFFEVGGALGELHRNGIIHFDVKPDNILIGKYNEYLLADFGISRKTRSNLAKTIGRSSFHSMSYSPPEKYTKNQTDLPSGDIFSLGVTAYELAMNNVPWDGQGGSALVRGAEIPDLPEYFNPYLRDVIYRCMSKDPLDRPSATELEEWAMNYLSRGALPFTSPQSSDRVAQVQNKGVSTVRMDRKNPQAGEQMAMPATAAAIEEKKMPKKKRPFRILTIAVFFVLAAILLCIVFKNRNKPAPTPSPQPQKIDTCSITGNIIDPVSNMPLKNNVVKIKHQKTKQIYNVTLVVPSGMENGIVLLDNKQAIIIDRIEQYIKIEVPQRPGNTLITVIHSGDTCTDLIKITGDKKIPMSDCHGEWPK